MNRSAPILVTGAAGFIGSHLVERLLAEGYSVIGLDNFDQYYDPAIKRNNIVSASQQPAYKLIEGDIRDSEQLDAIFSEHGIGAVIHLAARAGVRPSIEKLAARYPLIA